MYWTRRDMLKTLALSTAGLTGIGWAEFEPDTNTKPAINLANVPQIDSSDYQARQEHARALMAQHKIDALYLTGGSSLIYFSGVNWHRSERLFAMILPRKGDPAFVCPAFEEKRARELVGKDTEIRVWQEDESPYRLVKTILADAGIATGKVGVDETVRYFEADGLAKAAPNLRLVSGDPITHSCRGVKSSKELAIMRAANLITLEVYRSALLQLKSGMSEDEVARLVVDGFRKRGIRGGAMVLFGTNSAFPHGTKQRKSLREGMVVLMDGGCSLHGYRSDITRTLVFGEPTDRQQQVWEIVRKAQDAALRAARPGVPCGEVDAAARKVITDAGFGPGYRYFTHRLGHGIGLDGHEWPYLVKGNPLPLRPGMTFSNEPGIYIYGEFGIRLEDIMFIDQNGAKLFTPQSPSIQWPFV